MVARPIARSTSGRRNSNGRVGGPLAPSETDCRRSRPDSESPASEPFPFPHQSKAPGSSGVRSRMRRARSRQWSRLCFSAAVRAGSGSSTARMISGGVRSRARRSASRRSTRSRWALRTRSLQPSRSHSEVSASGSGIRYRSRRILRAASRSRSRARRSRCGSRSTGSDRAYSVGRRAARIGVSRSGRTSMDHTRVVTRRSPPVRPGNRPVAGSGLDPLRGRRSPPVVARVRVPSTMRRESACCGTGRRWCESGTTSWPVRTPRLAAWGARLVVSREDAAGRAEPSLRPLWRIAARQSSASGRVGTTGRYRGRRAPSRHHRGARTARERRSCG
ncbi:hypothetical protein STSO111631_16845 [Stackebrandtia soli]